MPRYNIGLRSGTHLDQTLSIKRDDLTALRVELARFVGDMLKDHAELIWEDQEWRLDVTDEKGLILYVMKIQALRDGCDNALRGRQLACPTDNAGAASGGQNCMPHLSCEQQGIVSTSNCNR